MYICCCIATTGHYLRDYSFSHSLLDIFRSISSQQTVRIQFLIGCLTVNIFVFTRFEDISFDALMVPTEMFHCGQDCNLGQWWLCLTLLINLVNLIYWAITSFTHTAHTQHRTLDSDHMRESCHVENECADAVSASNSINIIGLHKKEEAEISIGILTLTEGGRKTSATLVANRRGNEQASQPN